MRTMVSRNSEYKNLAHNAHSIGASEYHLQWVTKYRYDVLARESSWKDCEVSIQSAAKRHGITILEIGVMEDHVHVVAEFPQSCLGMNACKKGEVSMVIFKIKIS